MLAFHALAVVSDYKHYEVLFEVEAQKDFHLPAVSRVFNSILNNVDGYLLEPLLIPDQHVRNLLFVKEAS